VVRALPGATAGPDLRVAPAQGSGAPTPREAVAAATAIGAHLLAAVAEIIDEGQRTLDDWAGRLSDLPYPTVPAPLAGIPAGGRLEIG
jgi:hypothetical protein